MYSLSYHKNYQSQTSSQQICALLDLKRKNKFSVLDANIWLAHWATFNAQLYYRAGFFLTTYQECFIYEFHLKVCF